MNDHQQFLHQVLYRSSMDTKNAAKQSFGLHSHVVVKEEEICFHSVNTVCLEFGALPPFRGGETLNNLSLCLAP